MIQSLRIKNLALAENTSVEFGPGLNVITGETGAGKSILIGALGLLLGNRADKQLIRKGSQTCSAEALFLPHDADAINEILTQHGLDPCEENHLVIRRTLHIDGPGGNWINDTPVTLRLLRQVGDLLVDIHGPHEHQSLLRAEAQLDLIDSYAHAWKERERYETTHEALAGLERQRAQLEQDGETIQEQLDLLHHRIRELEEAALREEEEEELLGEHMLLGNAERIRELAGHVVTALAEGDPSAYDLLVQARQNLDRLTDILPEAEDWRDESEQVTMRLQELNAEINGRLADIDHHPDRLAWLDDRLALYARIKRKYGPSIRDALETLATSQARLAELENRNERIEQLEQDIARHTASLGTAGLALRKKRHQAARQLARTIQTELEALGLEKSSFTARFQEVAPRRSGLDAVEFEFAPNAGEDPLPLRSTASSGEMSRVMLAIKTALAAHDRIPILVFDEIDSNVGGETAHAVGTKLAQLSRNHQVLCITHFPQVAAHGNLHLAVTKSQVGGRTRSLVRHLEGEQRVEEIARMLGGRDLTRVTLDHAREMLRHEP